MSQPSAIADSSLGDVLAFWDSEDGQEINSMLGDGLTDEQSTALTAIFIGGWRAGWKAATARKPESPTS